MLFRNYKRVLKKNFLPSFDCIEIKYFHRLLLGNKQSEKINIKQKKKEAKFVLKDKYFNCCLSFNCFFNINIIIFLLVSIFLFLYS